MNETNLRIIENLKNNLENDPESNPEFCVRPGRDFSRNRLLSYKTVCLLILQQMKRTLALELEDFFELTQEFEEIKSPATPGAFCKARLKLKHSFFTRTNQQMLDDYYSLEAEQVKLWNGFRVLGVDSSTIYLLDEGDLKKEFGIQKTPGGEVVMGRLVCAHDVMNDLAIKTQLAPITTGEITVASSWLKEPAGPRDLSIYDRGFASVGLTWLHDYYGQHCVIRCKLSFNDQIKAFVSSGKRSALVDFQMTPAGREMIRSNGLEVNLNARVRVRLIRVELDSGETEVLITSLLDEKAYPLEVFKELYFLRWGVEVYFNRLKNQLKLELVSGHSAEVVRQDCYSTIFLSNIQSILLKSADKEVAQKTEGRKLSYRTNRNVSAGLLKKGIVRLILSAEPEEALNKLLEKMTRYMQPKINGRKYSHKKKAGRSTGKYQTRPNYRPA